MKNSPNSFLEKTRERVKEFVFNESEFSEFVEDAFAEGFISQEKKQKVLHSLKSDAKERLKLLVSLESFGLVAGTLMGSIVGGTAVSKGTLAAIKTYLATEAPLAVSRHMIVRKKGKNLPDKKRLSSLALIPFISVWSVLYSLYKKHPDLVEVFLVYSSVKRSFRKKNKHDSDSKEYQFYNEKIRSKFDRISNGIMINTLSKIQNVLSRSEKKSSFKRTFKKKSVPSRATFLDPAVY